MIEITQGFQKNSERKKRMINRCFAQIDNAHFLLISKILEIKNKNVIQATFIYT